MKADLNGKTVLITGGTGFVGSRLVEKICRDHEANVRVLVRDLSRVPRIARFPIEIVRGDVLQRSDVDRAIEGCDIVFHCAYGNQGPGKIRWKVNVEGTRNVAQAALRSHVGRFVHVSTWAVYGHPPDGDLGESASRRHSNYDYADSKLQAERIVFEHSRRFGLPVVVIQPTVVYGPYAPWIADVLDQLKSGRVILVNGGEGLCNAVYIDDVINAMLLAASADKGLGEAFLISGEEPVTWERFYRTLESMLGLSRTVNMTSAEARAYARKAGRKQSLSHQLIGVLREEPQLLSRLLNTREVAAMSTFARPSMKRVARKIVKSLAEKTRDNLSAGNSPSELPIHPLDSWSIRRLESKIRARIDKAKGLLGYRPAFSFETGIKLTEQWARWANLLENRAFLKEGSLVTPLES